MVGLCFLIIFYLVTRVIIFSIEKGEDIVKYNNVLQELEKEIQFIKGFSLGVKLILGSLEV